MDRIDDLAAAALSVVASRGAPARPPPMRPALLDRLIAAAMGRSGESYRVVVHHMLTHGVPPESIVDDYIPDAARRMGADWADDMAGFAEVTLGTSRLMSLLREISATWPAGDADPDARPSVLVAVPAGAQHTLGASVLVTQIRRAGASVRLVVDADGPGIAALLGTESHAALFVSASMGDPVDKLRQIVHSAKGTDPPHRPKVIVGGTIIQEHDDIRTVTGADLATMDVREALRFCSIDRN